jgi:hypothetical protein
MFQKGERGDPADSKTQNPKKNEVPKKRRRKAIDKPVLNCD